MRFFGGKICFPAFHSSFKYFSIFANKSLSNNVFKCFDQIGSRRKLLNEFDDESSLLVVVVVDVTVSFVRTFFATTDAVDEDSAGSLVAALRFRAGDIDLKGNERKKNLKSTKNKEKRN